MNYEILIDNKYFKKIRLSYGIIINIYKWHYGKDLHQYINTRKDIRKIDEQIYETKNEIFDKWNNITYPVGTKLFKANSCCYYVLKEPYTEYQWELKTTGDCFSGNSSDFLKLIKTIKEIIEREGVRK